METVQTTGAGTSPWNGGVSPFNTGRAKLTMWIFLSGDAILFATFLTAYAFARISSPAPWPDRAQVFSLPFIAMMTLILITSSVTMASAVATSKAGDRSKTKMYLWLTVLGGLLFLGCQAYEWSNLIGEGASMKSNPWGVPLFGACFFGITGFHGAHVLSGVLINALSARRVAKQTDTTETVEVSGLYWHFIDLVWVFIFTLFYLI